MFLSPFAVPLTSFESQSSYLVPAAPSSVSGNADNIWHLIRDLKMVYTDSSTQYYDPFRGPTQNNANNSFNLTLGPLSSNDGTSSKFQSNLTDEYSKTHTLENTIAIVVPILFSLIFVIGLFGNALVVIVVVFNASMRSTTNLLILNLAIADLLFILFCVPFTAVDYALAHWPFGMIWCKTVQYLIVVLACASNYTLVLMSLDRYLAVVHPIGSMSIRNPQNAYIAICLTWVFIILACIPAIPNHTIVKYGESDNDVFLSCTFKSTSELTHTQFQFGFMISSYLIPLLIAFMLYCLMLKKLWFGTSSVNSQLGMNNARCRKRVTRMVIIVVLTFAICWAPIQTILILKTLNMYLTDSVGIVIQIASQVLAYMNSCVNPILYAFLSENFRKAFHKVIACNVNLRGIYSNYGGTQSSYMQQTGQTSVAPSNQSNAKEYLPNILQSNRGLKSVNFSIVADGGLFPRNNQQSNYSDSESNQKVKGADESLINVLNSDNNKRITKPILSSKGTFTAKCMDDDDEADRYVDKMELHRVSDDDIAANQPNELSVINETMNKQTVTRMSSGSSGVFL